MVIIQCDNKNDESQFIFPHKLVKRSVACILPPYLQPIDAMDRSIERAIRSFVGLSPASKVREMRITEKSIIVCYAQNRKELLNNARETEELLRNSFRMNIKKEKVL